jgi:hypothetical protein
MEAILPRGAILGLLSFEVVVVVVVVVVSRVQPRW